MVVLRPRLRPPNPAAADPSMMQAGLAAVQHQEPFYSNPDDKPLQPAVFAGREFRLQGVVVLKLPVQPPTRAQTDAWLAAQGLTGWASATQQRKGSAVKPFAGGSDAGWDYDDDEEEEYDEPASPKYDERTFFFSGSTKSHKKRRDSEPIKKTGGRIRTGAQQRPPARQDAAAPPATAATAGAITSPAAAGSVPGGTAASLHLPGSSEHITPPAPTAAQQQQQAGGNAAAGRTPSQIRFKQQQGKPRQGARGAANKGDVITWPELNILAVEIHADSRGSLLPDPRQTSSNTACRSLQAALPQPPLQLVPETALQHAAGQPALPNSAAAAGGGIGGGTGAAGGIICLPAAVQVHFYASEQALLQAFCAVVQLLDPDVLVGWDIQQGSLGYLADRGAVLGFNVLRAASRTPEEGVDDAWGRHHSSGLHATGRILLNTWRLMSAELKLSHYSLEAAAAAVLRKRLPQVAHAVMARWFNGGHAGGRWRCLSRLAAVAGTVLDLLDTLDLPSRTAELARTFGIDFFSVLNRGSQYRVESMLVRLAHTQNYLTLSPSREQVGSQPATEALPLVMEPESRMYSCPVIVLDFQSLYPSLVIAYNLCYTTCVGRPAHAAAAVAAACQRPGNQGAAAGGTPAESAAPGRDPVGCQLHEQLPAGTGVRLGVSSYAPPPDALLPGGAADAEGLILAPNGVAFVPPRVRPGVLPRLLHEILATRVMVKAAMKRSKADKVLQRCLNARQFGLKMIANVSYGYTSASFSGRMPFAELADAIVQSGRVTLENAIRLVEGHPSWRAHVVYGDTDSLFIAVPGRSRAEGHRIGSEIAAAVTAANPRPVTLKLEKVYHPCLLQTKKRYVGFAFESADQELPVFDAKGIETVRRDSCPAVAKMLEAALRILFTSKDLSAVKDYCTRQWAKILSNRVSVQDFVFCKEVRLGSYSPNAATLPPAAIVAAKAMAVDPRAEPRYGERVPYVVVAGAPNSRLVDLVVSPQVLVQQDSSRTTLRLHANYYITKQIIPALERVLSLVGADVRSWFGHMRKPTRLLPQKRPSAALALPAPGAAGIPSRPSSTGTGQAAAVAAFSHGSWASTTVSGGAAGAGLAYRPGSSGFELAACLAGDAAHSAAGAHAVWPSPAATGADASHVGSSGAAGLLPGYMIPAAAGAAAGSTTIDNYYLSRHCAVCDELTRAAEPLCERCRADPQMSGLVLASRAARLERQHQHLVRLCQSCGGGGGWNVRHGGVVCASLDCGVYYERYKVIGELRSMSAVAAAGLQLL
eukprot:gene12067-12209_t